MKTTLSFANPAEVETDCLAVVVLDRGEKDKTQVSVETSDHAVRGAANEVIASGEVSGKIFETTLLHRPANLKAKRLLLVGGGKAKNFTSFELRRLAGTAVRFLKPKSIKSFALVVPDNFDAADMVKAVVEGAFVGNFDPDTYKSDRKDQKIESLTVVARGDQAPLQGAMDEARVMGESQNFTRELVNEPSNRMTPTMLAERAKQMSKEVGLKCEVYGADKIKEMKMGAFWSVAQGSDEPPALIVMKYEPAGAPEKPMLGLVGKGIHQHDAPRPLDLAVDELAPHRGAIGRAHAVVVGTADAEIHFCGDHRDALRSPPFLHPLRLAEAREHQLARCGEAARDDEFLRSRRL